MRAWFHLAGWCGASHTHARTHARTYPRTDKTTDMRTSTCTHTHAHINTKIHTKGAGGKEGATFNHRPHRYSAALGLYVDLKVHELGDVGFLFDYGTHALT